MATGNSKAEEENLPVALVVYDPLTASSVLVEPHTLKVKLQQTVTWLIEGVPENHSLSFSFDGFQDPLKGPFSSFSIEPESGTPQRATGESFGGALPGQSLVHYNVTVINAQGVPAGTSQDPVIEPLDPPDEPAMV